MSGSQPKLVGLGGGPRRDAEQLVLIGQPRPIKVLAHRCESCFVMPMSWSASTRSVISGQVRVLAVVRRGLVDRSWFASCGKPARAVAAWHRARTPRCLPTGLRSDSRPATANSISASTSWPSPRYDKTPRKGLLPAEANRRQEPQRSAAMPQTAAVRRRLPRLPFSPALRAGSTQHPKIREPDKMRLGGRNPGGRRRRYATRRGKSVHSRLLSSL
jgi:hypothetical protein